MKLHLALTIQLAYNHLYYYGQNTRKTTNTTNEELLNPINDQVYNYAIRTNTPIDLVHQQTFHLMLEMWPWQFQTGFQHCF